MTEILPKLALLACCGGIVALPVLAAVVITDEIRRWVG
jgi:hypothetical protein